MGLNLSALSKLSTLVAPTATKEEKINEPIRTEQRTELPKQEAATVSIVHAATSKPNQVIASLATLEGLAKSTKETPKSLDQSGGIPGTSPAEITRTIKYQEISDTISNLREAIHGAHPRMPGLLQEIWKTMQSYPEQVTLLAEDQMEIIIAGLEKVVDTDLAAISLKSALKPGGKGKAAITTDSLGF